MRNGGLGKRNAPLDIRGAQADVLVDGTSAVFFQGVQNPPPGRIGNGVQDAIHFESTVVNVNQLRRPVQDINPSGSSDRYASLIAGCCREVWTRKNTKPLGDLHQTVSAEYGQNGL